MAIDANNLRKLIGPTSKLPSATNQKLVYRWDLGQEYLVWFNTATGKLINCSYRAAVSPTAKALRESVNGYLPESRPTGSVPCSITSSKMGACDGWTYAQHSSEFSEYLRYHLKNSTSGSNATIAALTNNIINTPQSAQKNQFAYADYTQDWAANPTEAIFAVPPVTECTQVEAGDTGLFAVHSSLTQLRF
jgi:hypothetical protein